MRQGHFTRNKAGFTVMTRKSRVSSSAYVIKNKHEKPSLKKNGLSYDQFSTSPGVHCSTHAILLIVT